MSETQSESEVEEPVAKGNLTKTEGRVAMMQLAEAFDIQGITPETGMVEAAKEISEEFHALSERVAELEENVNAISDLGREKTTKEEKIAAIVQYSLNQATGSRKNAVALRPKEIKGVAGVSERYAYNLVDDLPQQYDFFLDKSEAKQYGSLQIDRDSQQRALLVDLELLQNDDDALNKFNNGDTKEGGR
jgi:polyhydroxyalkanoate synthesis regulator phasin